MKSGVHGKWLLFITFWHDIVFTVEGQGSCGGVQVWWWSHPSAQEWEWHPLFLQVSTFQVCCGLCLVSSIAFGVGLICLGWFCTILWCSILCRCALYVFLPVPFFCNNLLTVSCTELHCPFFLFGPKLGHANINLHVGCAVRTFIDHSEYKEAIADTLCQNILPEKYVLLSCRC
jgi:hypothetical protein